ncbi:phosphate acetyltransferase [Pseudomonas saudimassiliensis]|uniref:Phosphate acetyltransferase n=1 Tax=Pseudomonas saudimassiliensis TaxID=1461581 RepID=A0A078MCI5_9PSED|nr:phosphate acetyltransferase [Pseudomonas saudimassiliensis]CEA03127.1 phosphate acetyltransferase [Pseudomonas saudimassiliensis]CEF26084.1 phosphate acetyltransferase [Pseudomonas saudimassiliensis]
MHTFFLAPSGFGVGLTSVSLGLIRALERNGLRVHFLKPIAQPHPGDDGPERSTALISRTMGLTPPTPLELPEVERRLANGELDEVLEDIVSRYREAARDADVVVVEGMVPTRQAAYAARINQHLARSLDADIILVSAPDDDNLATLANRIELHAHGFGGPQDPKVLGVIINKVQDLDLGGDVPPDRGHLKRTLKEYAAALKQHSRVLDTEAFRLIGCVPWQSELSAPRSADVASLLNAKILHPGDMHQRRVLDIILCARTVPNTLHLFRPGTLLVVPGDRDDIIISSSLASLSGTPLAGLLLTGDIMPDERVMKLCQPALDNGLPIFLVGTGSFATSSQLDRMNREIPIDDHERAGLVTDFVASHIDHSWLQHRCGMPRELRMSPPAFRYDLVNRAQQAGKRIVLPEGDEPRTVQAAAICQRRGIAQCVLLAKPEAVEAVARAQHITLPEGLQIIDPDEVREDYVAPMVELRKDRGLTAPVALQQLEDNVVLGTMMLALDEVDGLVSGAVHTTANTIRPAFQLIKTAPEYSLVSSIFFMLLPDQVLVYGDCAVNPDPNASELAEIAIQSARSAAAFGIPPRVAMISYSTGSSGSGEDVEKVREATRLAREREPGLLIDGPLQYDAAAIASVGLQKAPDSPVAGKATVFIFPDLNTGNTTYKAVQRSANVISVGPMLQGLRKPVNDLSRGALVDDIVFTIALTAIQADTDES